jgi:FixJ family two-component response regulator
MNKSPETIFIIDDDLSIRESISLYLIANDYTVETFAGTEEYLAREAHYGTGCLLLDVQLKGKSGLDLQEELITANSQLPIIFISGKGNIQMTVQVMRKGAINFLEKPLNKEELLKSVNEALNLSRQLKAELEENAIVLQLIHSLTAKELEILKYIMSGMLYKQIAYELSIAEATVKVHRRNICNKFGVKSIPEIIRIAEKAGVIPSEKKY